MLDVFMLHGCILYQRGDFGQYVCYCGWFFIFYFFIFFTLALESGRTTPKTGVGGKKIKVLNHMSVKYLTLHYK